MYSKVYQNDYDFFSLKITNKYIYFKVFYLWMNHCLVLDKFTYHISSVFLSLWMGYDYH